MNAETSQPEPSLSRNWLHATILGWLIGLVLVVALAMLWSMIGGESQFMVGVGMGAGVGYMQARVARAWTGRIQPWLWTSIIGMGVPFVLWDIGSATGLKAFFSLPVCVLLGGLLTGALQHRSLRPQFERAFWWIPACVVGWGLPAALFALAYLDFLPPVFGFLSVIVMLYGGLLLGAVTGKTLQWMSPKERSNQRIQPTSLARG
jgi:hypothetical protein